ncbi:MAG: fimbrillin family protein, partial [Candidatus Cryptobacteroides sp.]
MGETSGESSLVPTVYLDNQEFKAVNGDGVLEWKAEDRLWWKDDSTPADFRCYHPYTQDAAGIRMLSCRVSADQTTHKALSESDILWGEALQVSPTSACVELMTSHRTGQIVIELVPGKGYDKTSLEADVEALVLKDALCGAVLDLETGELVSVPGAAEDVLPYRDGLVYRALLPPQNNSDFEVNMKVAGME